MHARRVPGLAFGVDPDLLDWRETNAPGIAWLPLYLEGDAGPRERDAAPADGTVLIRMDPGCGYPRHTHVGVEEVLVLRGGYTDELGTYREGEYLRYPAGSSHTPLALDEGGVACVLFASARGGIRLEVGPEA